jgi:hypothetical protein
VAEREDDRHPFVDGLHKFVGFRREDYEGDGHALGLAELVVIAPRVDAGHREWLSGFQHDAVELLFAAGERPPLIEAVGQDEAMAGAEAVAAVSRRTLFCGRNF